MADSVIQVYPDSTGKMIDTSSLTVAAQTVQRQRLNVADPTSATALAAVTAKGTQGAYALAVQLLHNTGRVAFSATASAVAGVVAEAMLSLTPVRDGTASGAATTFQPTSTKTLRLTSMICSVRASAAVASWARFSLRTLPTGSVIVTSPIAAAVEAGTPAATIGTVHTVSVDFPEGMEFAGTDQFGVSHIAAATTVLETVTLVGYEY